MVLGLLYSIVRSVLDLPVLCRKTEAAPQIEVLALRHQLRVLERHVHLPRFQPADRLLLSALSRMLPRPAWRSFLVSPETLLRWHRELVRWRWGTVCPPVPLQVQSRIAAATTSITFGNCSRPSHRTSSPPVHLAF